MGDSVLAEYATDIRSNYWTRLYEDRIPHDTVIEYILQMDRKTMGVLLE